LSKLKKYLLFVFIITWILAYYGCYEHNHGGIAGRKTFHNLLALSMFVPTLGVLFAKADIKEMGWRLRLDKNWKYIAFAWLAPTVFQIIGAVFYFMVFPEDFTPDETLKRLMVAESYQEYQKNGSNYWSVIAEEIFYSLTSFGKVTGTVLGLGEEIGWRGFMYPELKNKHGRTKGLLIGGVIHGAWHFPVMIGVGYEYGKEYIGAPVLGLVVFCLFTVSMGIVADFLYVKSGSIWLPAIFHATINGAPSPGILLSDSHPERSIFGPFDIGLISMIPMAVCAVFLLWYQYNREQMELDELFDDNSFSL